MDGERRMAMSLVELTSGPAAEPVEYAQVYATCLQAAVTYLRVPGGSSPVTPRDVYDIADGFMAQAIRAGKKQWDEGAITLTPEPGDQPVTEWNALLEAAELVVAGTRYGERIDRTFGFDQLRNAVAALREANHGIYPS